MVKTTLTAENVVEANKLSNNYKVGEEHPWVPLYGRTGAFFTQKNPFLQFGFKKWKSHVTARPWEDRSEIVKELYSDLNVIRGHGGGWFWGPDLGWRRWCG